MNQENRQKKIELIKKLQALADRGVGGEKEGARKTIEELIKKYGILESKLSSDKKDYHEFRYSNYLEKRLLVQIAYRMFGKETHDIFFVSTGKRNCRLVYCTEAESVQIKVEYEFYRTLWKEEEEFFMSCFIHKHDIFPQNEDAYPEEKYRETDPEKLLRMSLAIQVMQDKEMVPLLDVK